LRGLTSGVINVGESGVRGSCILVGDQFCGWLPHVGFLGMKVVGVLLKSSKLLGLIDNKFGDTCDVQVGDWSCAQMRADVVLVDGIANDEVLQVAKSAGARLVMSTVRKRRTIGFSATSWNQVGRERISHQFVGGITDRVVDLSIYQPPGATALCLGPPLAREVPRDASTVLSLKEHATMFRPIPSPDVVEPLACVNLGSLQKPIYHGRGLLPGKLDRHTWVLTPFLYSPKAKKEWGLRRLGIQETLACLDFPDDWAKWLDKAGVDREFVERQPAMSCFVAGGSRWLDALFSGNEGGKETKELRISSENSGDTKRPRVESPSKAQPLFSSKIQKRRDRDLSACHAQDQVKRLEVKDESEEESYSTPIPQPVDAQPTQGQAETEASRIALSNELKPGGWPQHSNGDSCGYSKPNPCRCSILILDGRIKREESPDFRIEENPC
jgi:hypothetical protein